MNALSPSSDDEPVVKKNEPVVKKKSNTRNLKIALGLAAVILIPTIGSTLAGSITINAGSAVEFGQGVSQTAACGNLTLTPTAVFTNVSDAGSFSLTTVTLSAIPFSCSGNTFTIKAYGESSSTPSLLSTRTGSALIVTPTWLDGTGGACRFIVVADEPSTPDETATCTVTSNIATVVINVASRPAADTIYKFTIETS